MLNATAAQGVRQYSSGPHQARNPSVKMDLSYKGDTDLPPYATRRQGDYKEAGRTDQAPRKVEGGRRKEEVGGRRKDEVGGRRKEEMGGRRKEDLSAFPKEHRGSERNSIFNKVEQMATSKLGGDARSLVSYRLGVVVAVVVGGVVVVVVVVMTMTPQVVAATNTALQPSTIATYLTQMWIGNIVQTIGWSVLGAFTGAQSGRSPILCVCCIY